MDGGGLPIGSRRHSCRLAVQGADRGADEAKLVRLLHRRKRRLCLGQQLDRIRAGRFYAPLRLAAGIPGTLAGNPQGFVGGITYGSNYQFDRLVIGIDSDFDFSNIKSSQTFTGAFTGVPFTVSANHEIKWFSTTRARAGFLLSDNCLLYGIGGMRHGPGRGIDR